MLNGLTADASPLSDSSDAESEPESRVTTAAGTGRIGRSDGPGSMATFAACSGVLPLPDGSVLVADTKNSVLRRLHQVGPDAWSVSTVASKVGWLMTPQGLALLPDGMVLIADTGHNRLRVWDWRTGASSVFAGSGKRGHKNGSADKAEFDGPSGLCVCASGAVLVADTRNHVVREAAEHSIAERSRAQQSVAERSRAQQSVAEGSRAQQSVAERSIAERRRPHAMRCAPRWPRWAASASCVPWPGRRAWRATATAPVTSACSTGRPRSCRRAQTRWSCISPTGEA